MVDSYSKVLNPSTQLLASLAASRDESDKWEVLEEAKKRGEWEKARREKDKKREEEKEKEMIAFAEIDWQDFVVVQTIEFTSTDQTIDLPPPTTIREMEKLTLNERKMAALIVEEVGERSDEQANGVDEDAEMEVEMDEESDDEETKDRKRKEQEEIQRAREVQAKAMGQAGMKIRKDYVPKGESEPIENDVSCHMSNACSLMSP
jgi:splicing factor 3A subunit 1